MIVQRSSRDQSIVICSQFTVATRKEEGKGEEREVLINKGIEEMTWRRFAGRGHENYSRE